jgi:hypothetical protein
MLTIIREQKSQATGWARLSAVEELVAEMHGGCIIRINLERVAERALCVIVSSHLHQRRGGPSVSRARVIQYEIKQML